MAAVVLLPGIVNPARPKFAVLAAELDDVQCEFKDLEIYADPRIPDDYSFADEVEGLHRFVTELGDDPVHLVGYSLGGAIALAYVAQHPDRVASVALDEPATDFTEEDRALLGSQWMTGLADLPTDEQMKGFFETMFRPGVEVAPPPPLPSTPEMALRPAGVATMLRALPRSTVDEDALRSYPGPMYLAYGSLSHERFEAMAARMPTRFPRCTVERFEGRHHLDPPHQAEPARVATALRALWSRV